MEFHYRHLILSEAADIAAEMACDHQGKWEEASKAGSTNEKLLSAVCRRLAFIESAVRAEKEKPPIVTADLVLMAEADSLRRRNEAAARAVAVG